MSEVLLLSNLISEPDDVAFHTVLRIMAETVLTRFQLYSGYQFSLQRHLSGEGWTGGAVDPLE